MNKNIGNKDRIIRIFLALTLFSTYFFLVGNFRYIALIGLISLLTGTFSFCPIYTLLGKSTCKVQK